MSHEDASPAEPGAVRLWPVALAGVVGLALTLAAWSYVRHAAHERLKARFELAAETQGGACRQRLEARLEVLNLLADHFAVRAEVPRAEFRALARGALARHPEMRALEWVPVVREAERAAFEARARLDGAPGFRLTDRDAAGALIPARPRPVHYPILYVEPYAGNERALGYAPARHPRDQAIERARDAGALQATARFAPVQATEGSQAVAIFAPVYAGGGVPPTVEARRQAIRGFVEAVLVVGEVLARPLAEAQAAGMDLAMLDVTAPPGDRTLFAPPAPPGGRPRPGPAALRHEVPIEAAGRRWVLAYDLVDPRPFEPFGGLEGVVLGAGLLGTGLMCAYLASGLTARGRVERLVVERTRSLRLEEERARSYLDVAAAVIVMVTPDGRVELINRQGGELLGWPQDEIVGEDWFERFVPADEREGARARAAEILAACAGSHAYEGRVLTRGGEERLIAWHTTCLTDAEGRPCATLSSGADVTGYTRAIAEVAAREAELRHARELDRLRDEFANAVSHDLRTPLTTIQGYAEFLADEVGGPLTPAQQAHVDQVMRGVKRVERLVDDLLDHARAEAGKLQLRLVPADVVATVAAVLESLGPQLAAARVEARLEAAPGPLAALMDPPRIERVVGNLLFNAIKFTPPGGTITLRVVREAGVIRAEVADTGPGIAEDQAARLFHRFTQLANASGKGGAGLGLSISREIVEAHGGAIGVESVPGRGATFWFTLPAAQDGDLAG